jgi:hypothetical protein
MNVYKSIFIFKLYFYFFSCFSFYFFSSLLNCFIDFRFIFDFAGFKVYFLVLMVFVFKQRAYRWFFGLCYFTTFANFIFMEFKKKESAFDFYWLR